MIPNTRPTESQSCNPCVCVCVCTFNRALTVGTAALVRQVQPTPVPRVIPVIIAPFGVGAGVQLLIWSFYNELSRWAACRWCRPVPRWRRCSCASQFQDPSFVQGGEYRQHCCHVPFSQVNFHGSKNQGSLCMLKNDFSRILYFYPCRAAEKLNLTSRKKGQASDPAPAHLSTCFRELIQKNPPVVPPCLLQAATRTKDSPNLGKVLLLQPPWNSTRSSDDV